MSDIRRRYDNAITHDFTRHSVQRMRVSTIGDELHLFEDEEHELESLDGCHDCNMGWEEAQENQCPKQDLFDDQAVYEGE